MNTLFSYENCMTFVKENVSNGDELIKLTKRNIQKCANEGQMPESSAAIGIALMALHDKSKEDSDVVFCACICAYHQIANK